jgi:TatD DNase family protein
MTLLVDSHCHLDLLDVKAVGGDLAAVMQNARARSVGYILCVSVNLKHFPRVRGLAESYAQVFASAGVHPNDKADGEPSVKTLCELADHPRVVAVGETGLDYYRSQGEPDWQRERFRRHIAAARETGRPLIIHAREAKEDTLKMLAQERAAEVGGVMHCFAEDWDMALRAMDLNFLISFSGIVTFPSAQVLKDVARRLPLDRMLVETDAPWLAPIPHRGKPNQPAYARYVAEHIASLRDTGVDEIITATTANFFGLFSRAQPVPEGV